MYESYSWPGAYNIKTEFKMFFRPVRKILVKIFKINKMTSK